MTSPQPGACLVCGGTSFETVLEFEAPDAYERAAGVLEAGYRRRWLRCQGCAFHQSDYSRPPEILDRLYETTYRDAQAAWRGGDTRAIFERVIALPPEESETVARVDWISRSIQDLASAGFVSWSDAERRMLDIGGATGVFAHAFANAGWSATVIDPADSGAFLAELGIEYRQMAYQPGLCASRFHLVSLVFVLEHLRDPISVLTECRQDLVAPDGLVYVEVPDALAFQRKPPDDDIFNSCHLWMFDPAALVAIMASAGLQVAKLDRTRTRRGHLALRALGQAR